MFDYQDSIAFVGGDGNFAESLPQIEDRDNLASQIDDAFDVVWSIGHSGDFGHAHNLAQCGDGHAVSFPAHLEADYVQFAIHELSGWSRRRLSLRWILRQLFPRDTRSLHPSAPA